jgi:hypothetical protein
MANKDAEFSLSHTPTPDPEARDMGLLRHACKCLSWKESSHQKQYRINWLIPNVSQNHFSKRPVPAVYHHAPAYARSCGLIFAVHRRPPIFGCCYLHCFSILFLSGTIYTLHLIKYDQGDHETVLQKQFVVLLVNLSLVLILVSDTLCVIQKIVIYSVG